MTQIDSEDTVPISKLSKIEKSSTVAEKRPAAVVTPDAPPPKKPRPDRPKGSNNFPRNMTWAPEVMVRDRPLPPDESVIESVKVGVVLSTAVLLPEDMNHMDDLHAYETFGLMLQHSVLVSLMLYPFKLSNTKLKHFFTNLFHSLQVIQHTHSYAIKTKMMRKELVKKSQEATKLLSSLNHAEASNQNLLDQAKAAQTEAETKARVADTIAEPAKAVVEVAKARARELEAKLKEAIDLKEAKVKAADERLLKKAKPSFATSKKS